MRTKRLILAVVLALAVTLAGCVSLPSSGPVTSAEPELGARQPLAQHAAGPRRGTSPRQLIEDFQRACAAGSYDGFAVARQYLTKATAKRWNPQQSVIVVDSDPGDGLKVEMTGSTPIVTTSHLLVVLAVDELGRSASSAAIDTWEYSLTRENGQWRIQTLPDGIVLTKSAFSNAYARRDVYFYSADWQIPVADPRWIARKDLVHGLVQALYAGPSAAVANSVRSALPTTVADAAPVVDVAGQLASVTVPQQVAALGSTQRTRALWQFQLTLAGVRGIAHVELRSGRQIVSTDKLPDPPNYDLDYLVGVAQDEVVKITDSRVQTFIGADQLAGVKPRWPATGPLSGSPAVLLNSTQTALFLESGDQQRRLLQSTGFTRPCLDIDGFVWLSTGPDGLVIVNLSGGRVTLTPPWDRNANVSRVVVNPDGSRLATVRHIGNRDVVEVFTIEREGAVPTALTSGTVVAQPLTTVNDISWMDQTTLAVLGKAQQSQVLVHPVNGLDEIYEAPSQSATLVTGGSTAKLQVLTTDRQRQERVGRQWRPVDSGVADVNFAG